MGRAPKYLTLQDKLQARQAAKRRYAASDRGKDVKSIQNARAYVHRTAKTVNHRREASVTMVDQHPQGDIPAHLVALAQLPLSSSRLFDEALTSADALDESDLGVWNLRPPYHTLPAHQENDTERRFTQRLVEVMHGKRFRELRADGEDRVRRIDTVGLQEMVEGLEERVAELLVVCHDDAPEAIASAKLPGSGDGQSLPPRNRRQDPFWDKRLERPDVYSEVSYSSS
ncbi:hypothetical protein OH76DRAFT_1485646 [Lentinus brumalis]|uniref:Uncharacterized protein n=1 Tax=Lentinus brumalis TaxID=2498619 RepID=A0A371D128_9APHY|nr:hypothetical protein OH76DRAFT_1485646 [Polyporus brumalis]